MADTGWGFGWILAGIGLGCYAGYKMIPWMRRVEEVEALADLAERVLDIAEEESHKVQALECLRKIEKYRQGILDKTEDPEDHEGIITKLRKNVVTITKKLNPFSSNGKDKKNKVELELNSDAA